MEDVDYTWLDVSWAVDRCFSTHSNGRITHAVKDVYNNGLPMAIDRLACICFMDGSDQFNQDDLALIKRAYKQLQKEGRIGK